MKEKLLIWMLIITVISSSQPLIAASQTKDPMEILLNDQRVPYDNNYGFPFVDNNSRTLVPFRITLETFGATVTWNEKDQVAIAKKGAITVRVPIGEKYIYKNNEIIINDTFAQVIQGRTYLPIRVVMEAFGCQVNWAKRDNDVYITYKETDLLLSKLPSQFDLRDNNKVTAIRDQKNIGACWAFAAIGAIESNLLTKNTFDFSEDHLSLNHGYNLKQDQGGDINVTLGYLARWGGPVYETEDPYGDYRTNKDAAVIKHIQEAIILPNKDFNAIKSAILRYGAIQTSMYFDSSIMLEVSQHYNSEASAYYYKGNAKINHAVTIVGWDDQFSSDLFSTKPDGNGAFICKNSYGKTFGDDGYFYVSYYDKYIGTDNVTYSKVEPVNNYKNIYQTDTLGWVGRIGFGTDTAYFANVYELKKSEENLSAISFYATEENTTYELYLVENFEKVTDFKKMVFVKKGVYRYKGYYTIELDASVEVDQRFAVVLKVTSPGSTLPVAAEYYKNVSWLGEVDITDGEGYISQKGSVWVRTEDFFKSNVCLKVFTK